MFCTREIDGEFHAFLNVCRHRGTLVENEDNSHSEVSFYLHPQFDEMRKNPEMQEQVEGVENRMQSFAEVIQMEDYVAAASNHAGALSGAQEYITFGRNEPTLHHYHNTYRQALGMPPLDVISN